MKTATAVFMPDETLNHWADRFMACGLAQVMRFDTFIAMSPALRNRRVEWRLQMNRRCDCKVIDLSRSHHADLHPHGHSANPTVRHQGS